jgi:hypothetical protein
MTLARFKALCMDASDALQLADFWARVLGVQVTDLGDRTARVDGNEFCAFPPRRPA